MEQARIEHAPNGSLLTYITSADALVNKAISTSAWWLTDKNDTKLDTTKPEPKTKEWKQTNKQKNRDKKKEKRKKRATIGLST